MKLILNARFFNRPATGVERVALELSRSLRALLATSGQPDLEIAVPTGTPVADGVAALGQPATRVSVVGRLGGHAWEQAELARAMPEDWILNLCNTGPITRRRQVLLIHDAQVVLHPESYSRAFRWWYRVMITLASRRAAVLLTISNSSKMQLERFRLVPRGKAIVLRLGVDHLDATVPEFGILAQHGLEQQSFFLVIGSLARHKNLAMLIEAFVAADLPNLSLVVAGGGNPKVFKGAGLREAPNIRFLGRVTDAELKALYAAAYAFACPSLSEGFGLTPLEAMRMGCPVMATTGGAVPEVCGDAALYADPRDVQAWSETLRRIATDGPLRADLARRARERAALFTWQGAAQQLLNALSAPANGRPHPPRK
ncbi:glycosyltransferase family 4 protein [Sphingomonas sp. ACRSK]|uniref:glycosyltransferase family 4 protein n=1 Tax=Sphingomonas sp. ACRSK TaxID=2918213 RepID=UPI001EF749B2|nr:glycosyltransferase family 1 protein [Sphingomonas sp. ACRSK]MCG7349499.1 glycosyltransferase family 4 protein [Sphingomonas sp. ACRSK]